MAVLGAGLPALQEGQRPFPEAVQDADARAEGDANREAHVGVPQVQGAAPAARGAPPALQLSAKTASARTPLNVRQSNMLLFTCTNLQFRRPNYGSEHAPIEDCGKCDEWNWKQVGFVRVR